MKWEDVRAGQFVLYDPNTAIWLSQIIEKDKKSIKLKNLYCNKGIQFFIFSEYLLKSTEGWKILKVYDEVPKEFLI